jgi:hypothetical protein
MPIRKKWKLGDHLVKCDRTGRTVYASQSRKEWNNLRVWTKAWFPRQPQDLVRGLTDKQTVDDPRPPTVDEFTGPLTTELNADHAAGATTLTVLSSLRFAASDRVLIGLNNNSMFATTVQTIPDSTSITIAAGLSWAASDGNTVINTTQVSGSDIS